MGMNRRNFIKLSSSLGMLLPLRAWPGAINPIAPRATGLPRPEPQVDWNKPNPLPIIQGHTTSTTAQFLVNAPKDTQLKFQILDSGNAILTPSVSKPYAPDYSEWQAQHLSVMGLDLSKTYTLKVLDGAGKEIDRRDFAPLDTNLKTPRFAIVSCAKDIFPNDQGPMWMSVMREAPDVILMMGDNVYVDVYDNDPIRTETIWLRYIETRMHLDIYHKQKLTPIYAIWDDHDYGQNNVDKNFKYAKQSTEIFLNSYAQRPDNKTLRAGYGIGTVVDMFGQRFVLLDNRSFRDPKGSNGLQWGSAQETWLHAAMANSLGPIWLLNGTQFFGAYRSPHSVEKHSPSQLKRLMKKAGEVANPIVLVSGDIHFSEIMKVKDPGYTTYEITSSSIHSARKEVGDERNRRRMMAATGFNFVVVDVVLNSPKSLDFRAASYGPTAQALVDTGMLRVMKT